MDSISDLKLFRAIVDAGGISAAARALGSSPAAISRRLSALEARLGVSLADRRTRRLTLTQEGEVLYARSGPVLDAISEIEAEVSSRGSRARGLLSVGSSTEIGRRHVAPLLADFADLHPGLQIRLTLSDAGLEVIDGRYDLVVRVGKPEDAGLIVRKVASAPRILCASPVYIERHGAPATPADLRDHNCLLLARNSGLVDTWDFGFGPDLRSVRVAGRLTSGSGDVLHAWLLAGKGLSLEAMWDVADDLAAERVRALLTGYQCDPVEIFVVFAPGRPIPPRIRLFVDYFVRRMA